jgi:hypothetical protein
MPPAVADSSVPRPRRSRRRERRIRILIELVGVMIIAAITAWLVFA